MFRNGVVGFVMALVILPNVQSLQLTPVDEEHLVKTWWDIWWAQNESKVLRAPPENQTAQDWWDHTANEAFQHLDEAYVNAHMKDWQTFLPRFEWKGKSILDYGIGGGYLGKILLRDYGINHYTGVDISQKALDAAQHTLANWNASLSLHLTPLKFSDATPTILVSQQVIQHFPSVEYLSSFLNNVDNSRASQLMLHFRQSKNKTTYSTDAYNDGGHHDVTFALLTDVRFLKHHLKNYRFAWKETRPMCCGTTGVYTGWNAI